ncbi:MAG: ABC transporter permease [Rhodothermia bacterium]
MTANNAINGCADREAVRSLPVYDSAAVHGPMRDAFWELIRYKDLLRLLVVTNIKARYKRSVLGMAWTLLNPLLMMIVMTIAFSALFRFSLPHYPVYVLSGLVLWQFFTQTTTHAMNQLAWGNDLLKKVYIPPTVFPVSAVGTGLVNLGLSVIPLAIIMLVIRHPFTWALLWLPVSVFLISLFCIGLGLLISIIAVFFSDFVQMYGVILRIWFFLTPVMYPERILPERFVWIVKMNPMYHLMRCWRDPIYLSTLPPIESVLVCVVSAFGTLFLGWWLFSRKLHEFAVRA